MSKNPLLTDIAKLQKSYQKLYKTKLLTKKNMCELVVPFRDKYSISDSEALLIARGQMSIIEIDKLLN